MFDFNSFINLIITVIHLNTYIVGLYAISVEYIKCGTHKVQYMV